MNLKLVLSVVIPTFNRSNGLLTTLKKLEAQSFSENFEVVVVDDGSTDDTQKVLKSFQTKKFALKILLQKNKKQGAARNFGVSESSSDLVVFLQDDIWPGENFLQVHYDFHKKTIENFVAIGKTFWTEDLQKDRFHKFLDGSSHSFFPAPLFDYESLKNEKETDFFHFYTNNLSIKKSFFQKEKFDEKFASYGWEDVELGFRLFKNGMKIFFLEKAKAEHFHPYTFDSFLAREKKVAENLENFLKLQPELKTQFKSRFLKKIIFFTFSLSPFLALFKLFYKEAYWYFSGKKQWISKK